MAKLLVFLILVLPAFGCGTSTTPSPPSYSPAASAQRAMAEYDSNKDGKLDAEELQRCPALLRSLPSMDLNKDGCLDAHEIEERLTKYEGERLALMSVSCRVTRDKEPVAGVEVTFTPEKFHGDSLKIARGTSDKNGYVTPQVEGLELPGVPAGFYRLTLSLKDGSGKETLPARFSAATHLGWEISTLALRRGGIRVELDQ